MATNPQEQRQLALAAAYFRSQNKSQAEIAELLGITQPHVSRLLGVAEVNKWLAKAPAFYKPVPGTDDYLLWKDVESKHISYQPLFQALHERWDDYKRLRSLTVLESAAADIPTFVIGDVINLILNAKIIGLTWGYNVRNLIEGMRRHLRNQPPIRIAPHPIQVVPLCGEPISEDSSDPIEYSSSALAVLLWRLLNGRDDPPPLTAAPRPTSAAQPASPPKSEDDQPHLMAGCPAFLPLYKATPSKERVAFTDPETRTLRDYVQLFAGYRAVFGSQPDDPDALANRLDTLITGVGRPQGERIGTFLRERKAAGELSEAELEQWVVGDIAGVILARDAPQAFVEKIQVLNARWTGVSQKQIQDCAKRAAAENKPGVIVLAPRRDRKEMIRYCINNGLINHLIIDKELADDLEKDFPPM